MTYNLYHFVTRKIPFPLKTEVCKLLLNVFSLSVVKLVLGLP